MQRMRASGDVDKYVGDEIVAIFSGEGKEERACRSPLQIQSELARGGLHGDRRPREPGLPAVQQRTAGDDSGFAGRARSPGFPGSDPGTLPAQAQGQGAASAGVPADRAGGGCFVRRALQALSLVLALLSAASCRKQAAGPLLPPADEYRGWAQTVPAALTGLSALEAVLNPVDGPWQYFVANELTCDGTHEFAETYGEHLANIQKYQTGGCGQ